MSLDEYLDLRDKVQKIDKLKCIGKIIDEEETFHSIEYGGFRVKTRREIVLRSKDLTEYINDILGVRGYELRIEFDKENDDV